MTRLQLARLVQWAEVLDGRKRLQKVIYLMQCAGVDLKADYRLHHYGPYSEDVADQTRQLVALGILEETEKANRRYLQYEYRLAPQTQADLAAFDAKPSASPRPDDLTEHRELAEMLLEEDLQSLELASTVAFYRVEGREWEAARVAAARFKNRSERAPEMRSAEDLARRVIRDDVAAEAPRAGSAA